jgi:hypothetical protein
MYVHIYVYIYLYIYIDVCIYPFIYTPLSPIGNNDSGGGGLDIGDMNNDYGYSGTYICVYIYTYIHIYVFIYARMCICM